MAIKRTDQGEEKSFRTDKKKNIDKVAAELAKDPLATEREIAKRTGLGNGTINRSKKELEQTGAKDPRILALTDADYEILALGQREMLDRIQDPQKREKISTSDLNVTMRESAKRYQTFRGNATDENGGATSVVEALRNAIFDKSKGLDF